MNESSILLADLPWGEIVKFLVIAAIIGFSIISKLLGARTEGQAQPRPNRPPPRPRPPAAEPPQPQSIEQEIEMFLRQARGGKQAAAPRQAPPAPPAPRRPLVAEVVPVSEAIEPGRDFGRSVSSHVQEHLGSKPIGESAAHLGEGIEAADERLEHRLEEVFSHDVGHLTHADQTDTSISEGTDAASWDETDRPDTTPGGIAEMLRSPGDIRKVFILSEILNRREM